MEITSRLIVLNRSLCISITVFLSLSLVISLSISLSLVMSLDWTHTRTLSLYFGVVSLVSGSLAEHWSQDPSLSLKHTGTKLLPQKGHQRCSPTEHVKTLALPRTCTRAYTHTHTQNYTGCVIRTIITWVHCVCCLNRETWACLTHAHTHYCC